ncbi:MAG: hypothetical protein AAGE96_18230 [Cyanobacteria bacterium P01_G01_bin.19]
MNIYVLRENARKTRNKLLGKIENNRQNWSYLQDLESWGSVEILSSNDAYIEYSLI